MVDDKTVGGFILTFIIALAIVVAFVSIFLSGLNEFSESDACTDADPTCAFDNPQGFCAINSSSEGSGIACGITPRESLPLGVLFAIALPVLFAAGVFIALRNFLRKK